ncbi:MAG: O-antigen ligase family protein, partial [Thermodesulfobacteriota bacterium]
MTWFRPLALDAEKEPARPRWGPVFWADLGTLFCLSLLAATLPIAQITVVREIGLWLGLFFWLARMYLAGKWEFLRTPLDLPLALLLLAGIISVFTSGEPGTAFDQIKGEMVKWILIYYLAVNNLRTERRALVFFGALFAGAVVMDVYGLYYFFTHGGSLTRSILRLASLHAGSPQFGDYLIQTAPYIAVGALWLRSPRWKVALALLLAIHAFVLYLTFGRMDLWVFVLEALLILYLTRSNWKALALVILVGFLVLFIFSPRPVVVLGKKAPAGQVLPQVGVHGLKGSRLLVWKTGWAYLREHPFTGIGFGRHMFGRK